MPSLLIVGIDCDEIKRIAVVSCNSLRSSGAQPNTQVMTFVDVGVSFEVFAFYAPMLYCRAK